MSTEKHFYITHMFYNYKLQVYMHPEILKFTLHSILFASSTICIYIYICIFCLQVVQYMYVYIYVYVVCNIHVNVYVYNMHIHALQIFIQ